MRRYVWLRESFRPSTSLRTVLRCDPFDCDIVMVFARHDLLASQGFESALRIVVAMFCSFLIPFCRLFEIDRDVHTNLVEVSESKLCCGETTMSRSLGVGVAPLFVLGENAIASDQEPLGQRHVGFGLSLLGSQCIVVY
jgi:hypothetical protein